MFGDSDNPGCDAAPPNPRQKHSNSGPLDLQSPPTKPHLFRAVGGAGSSSAAAPQELTFSYLCDIPKLGLPEKDGPGGDLLVSFDKSRLQGKRIAPDPTGDHGEQQRWVERDFLRLAGGRKRGEGLEGAEADSGGGHEKKVKIETLNLSLAPPSLSLSLNSSIPAMNAAPLPAAAVPPVTAAGPSVPISLPPKKSYSANTWATNSEDYGVSISYSCSVPFSHNPSCSLTRNSTENCEFSRGENEQMWYAGEGTNGSVHSRFRPVGDGNTIAFVNHNTKELNNSFCRANGPDNTLYPSELPARPAKSNVVISSDSGRNAMLTRPDKLLREIVSDSIPAVAQRLREYSTESLEALKECLRKLMDIPEKKNELASLMRKLERRSDLTSETLSKAHKTQLDILVAVKTGIASYVSGKCRIPTNELVEIFLLTRCRNVNCKSLLPVDDCDCKICSTQKGFCSACMCPVCLKFDFASNTCSWVGCDVCSHWCHAACGIKKNLIRPGPSLKGPTGTTEMQFHCLGCGHDSDMLGFVKEVFNVCAKDWDFETLTKELDCVRNIFRASEDFEGKGLHTKAEEVLNMLTKKLISLKDGCASMLQFFKYGVTEFSVTGSSSKNILAQVNQNSDVLPLSSTTAITASILDKPIDMLKSDAKPLALEPHCTQAKEDGFQSLETMVKFKEAEAKLFQRLADDARREVEGYRQIARAKSEKLEEEYATKLAKLCLKETEDRQREKLEELKLLENSHCDYLNMKMRMQNEIASLLERMEATRKMWS